MAGTDIGLSGPWPPNTDDPCVCAAPLRSFYRISDTALPPGIVTGVMIRTKVSEPCTTDDWVDISEFFDVEASGNVIDTNGIAGTPGETARIQDLLDGLAATSHAPVNLSNSPAPFEFNAGTQSGNIPLWPSFVDNGDGTYTLNLGDGTSVVFHIGISQQNP